jgi:hypothetical protein
MPTSNMPTSPDRCSSSSATPSSVALMLVTMTARTPRGCKLTNLHQVNYCRYYCREFLQ